MTREHPIKTAARSGVLTVTECPDRITVRLTFDRYGDCGDAAEIARQIWPLFSRFDTDPRPIDFDAPDLGQRAVIDSADGCAFAVLAEETRQ